MSDTMELPVIFIHQSFRYVLGRRTYAVHEWCDWTVRNWNCFPESEKAIIERELEEAFQLAESTAHYHPLGDPCDQEGWKRVRAMYRGDEKH